MHQNLSIEDDNDIKERAEELDCNTDVEFGFVPVGLKSAKSKDDLSYHETTITVDKLAQSEGIDLDTFVDYEDLETTRLKSTEIFLGGIYVAAEFVRNNPEIVLLLIQLIKDHYSKGTVDSEAEISLLIEDEDGSVTKLEYEGAVDEIDVILNKVGEMVGVEEEIADSEIDD